MTVRNNSDGEVFTCSMLDDSRDLLEIERYSECILLVFIEVLNESAGEDVVVGQ